MASVSVITASQLGSIREKVLPPAPTSKTRYIEELHQQSKDRAARWPNTLEAERERKERARAERLAADEVMDLKRDAAEAKIRADKRQEVLARVGKVLFEQTDRVKGFHGAVLHADVLAERSAQIAFDGRVRALEAEREAAFVRQQAARLEAAEDAEVQKMQDSAARARAQRDAQMEQLEALKRGILAEREDRRHEGEMLKVKVAAEAAEAVAAEAAGRQRAKDANAATARANDALQEFKRRDAEREREADAAIEAYARKKEALAAERTAREAARAAAKDARRKAMVELMETKFKAFISNEEARLERDVQDAQSRSDADAAARAAQRKAEWDAICRSRAQQLALRAAKKDAAAREDLEFVRAWQAQTKRMEKEEAADAEAARSRSRHFAGYQRRQRELKAARKEAQKLQALQEAAMAQKMASEGQDRYRSYAQGYIDEYRSKGKPVAPMVLHLNKPEPFASA